MENLPLRQNWYLQLVENKMESLLGKIRQKKEIKAELKQEAKPETVDCKACGKKVDRAEAIRRLYVCPECGGYFRVNAKNRIKMVADTGSFTSWFDDIEGGNPLGFPGYEEKLHAVQEKTGLKEGVVIGKAQIYGEDTVLGVVDARFLMGSMGHVVGEKIAAAVERATEEKLPVILFCCSGGARMQEGIVSLMQMAKTSAALKKHSKAGLLYMPVLTDPTTGGMTASFAMLGDIILAEPKALIGFAGPRVIEQTIGQKLPAGFQRSEFQVEHGFVDRIVERKDLKKTLYDILKLHHKREGFVNLEKNEQLSAAPSELMRERAAKTPLKDAWEKVEMARKVSRISSGEYIEAIFDGFMEMHGDRYFGDDPAILGGVAYLDGQPVTVIGVQKGKDLKDCLKHNYGMPSPEGYRKALRLMKQAEKFNRPVITFVNTSGAFCGMEAEERGQAEAIARNLYEMSALKVPILCMMIGEGGSGGALALSVGNEVWMMENATYSVLSPEGFASILWKDSKRAKEAAGVMKITAHDLHELHIVDKIIPEYGGADSKALDSIARYMKVNIREFLERESGKTGEELAEERYRRFRAF
jgi:acetyl-CoA carboxylase carboxyl transferase alpha subunit/acetyl-CoA carboxylase carboxyl transferase beta subunit